MKQLEAILRSATTKQLAVNLTVAIVVPIVVSAVTPFVRPVGRGVLKTGILAIEKLRETASEFGELVEDLTAEVQDELQQRREQTAGLVNSEQGSYNRTDKDN
jgi:hypothetical protein